MSTPERTAYRAGWDASKRTTTCDLDAAEARFERRFGADFGGTMFAAGWGDYAADRPFGYSLDANREQGRPCYCLSLMVDHMAGAPGCGYNADFTEREPVCPSVWRGWEAIEGHPYRCSLPQGHEGRHEDRTTSAPETYCWANVEPAERIRDAIEVGHLVEDETLYLFNLSVSLADEPQEVRDAVRRAFVNAKAARTQPTPLAATLHAEHAAGSHSAPAVRDRECPECADR